MTNGSGEIAPILQIRDLRTSFVTSAGIVRAVDGVSFDVRPGEIFGLVGESGCGKSATCRSIIRLLPSHATTEGEVLLNGEDLLTAGAEAMRQVRGGEISMIFQDPMSALNPVLRVGEQVAEAVQAHRGVGRRAAWARALELLRLVGIPAPERRLREYPYQFSGGMRQRVLIAIALAGEPNVLLADEPTTALDVTIQDQILKLIVRLQRELGMSVILVSHDLAVIAHVCQRVAVMYAGQIVEQGEVRTVLRAPRHPYTMGLLASLPGIGARERYLQPIAGAPPSLLDPPSGCRFHPRCTYAVEQCRSWTPELLPVGPGHGAACWRQDAIRAGVETTRIAVRETA
ncbi:MAG: ABC transporter ATP-binding protein [Chloroflexota bacterium]|nr:ABC transporter ATP-binding protein [Chloroflexota bacterium]